MKKKPVSQTVLSSPRKGYAVSVNDALAGVLARAKSGLSLKEMHSLVPKAAGRAVNDAAIRGLLYKNKNLFERDPADASKWRLTNAARKILG